MCQLTLKCLSAFTAEQEKQRAVDGISGGQDSECASCCLRTSRRPEGQGLKLITPVRRSARIERAVSHYPEMLQDHDLVVASLDELLGVEETEYFVFRRNEALPVTLGFQVLES